MAGDASIESTPAVMARYPSRSVPRPDSVQRTIRVAIALIASMGG